MSKLLAALTIVAGLILFTPLPASAAAKSDGVRNAAQYEVSSRHRRYHRRVVYVRPVYRPWRPYWGPRWGWRRAYWGPAYGFYRPWRPVYRPWGWGYRPWGWGGYRSYAWGRPWGWGYRPGVTVSFGVGRGGWWW